MSDPEIDIAAMARAQGAAGLGPVRDIAHLRSVLEEAVRLVRAGAVCVVDVRVEPGYGAA
jgi:hypothetical protein